MAYFLYYIFSIFTFGLLWLIFLFCEKQVSSYIFFWCERYDDIVSFSVISIGLENGLQSVKTGTTQCIYINAEILFILWSHNYFAVVNSTADRDDRGSRSVVVEIWTATLPLIFVVCYMLIRRPSFSSEPSFILSRALSRWPSFSSAPSFMFMPISIRMLSCTMACFHLQQL